MIKKIISKLKIKFSTKKTAADYSEDIVKGKPPKNPKSGTAGGGPITGP